MSRYHLELSDQELFTLQMSMAFSIRDLEKMPFYSFSPEHGLENYQNHRSLLRRLMEAPKLPGEQASAQTPPLTPPLVEMSAAVPVAAGAGAPNSPTAPERDSAVGELTITLFSAEVAADKKSLVTTFKVRTSNGVKTNKLRCWDAAQWEAIQASVGTSTTFLVREKGGYTNIVGVKR